MKKNVLVVPNLYYSVPPVYIVERPGLKSRLDFDMVSIFKRLLYMLNILKRYGCYNLAWSVSFPIWLEKRTVITPEWILRLSSEQVIGLSFFSHRSEFMKDDGCAPGELCWT